MTHYLNWFDLLLIGWLVVSALVTPLIGRFLGAMFPDSGEDEIRPEHEQISARLPHDADA